MDKRRAVLDRTIGTTAVIEITGHNLDAEWFFALTSHGWKPRQASSRNPDDQLRMAADEAWRLLTNNLGAAEQRRLSTSGDTEILEVLIATRAIIGAPK